MNETGRARFSRALRWLLAAVTLLLAALLIWQCAAAYLKGTSPANRTETGVLIENVFSREIAAERFGRIAWAVWLWAALLAAALVLRVSGGRAALKAPAAYRLEALLVRCEKTEAMRAEETKRRRWLAGCVAVCALCAAAAGVYLARPDSFASRDLETTMGRMLRCIAPCAAAAIAALAVYERAREKSLLREIELAKEAPRRQAPLKEARSAAAKNVCRAALLAAAAALIALGVCNGGMRDVLVKAINICTECIGLG